MVFVRINVVLTYVLFAKKNRQTRWFPRTNSSYRSSLSRIKRTALADVVIVENFVFGLVDKVSHRDLFTSLE